MYEVGGLNPHRCSILFINIQINAATEADNSNISQRGAASAEADNSNISPRGAASAEADYSHMGRRVAVAVAMVTKKSEYLFGRTPPHTYHHLTHIPPP